MQFFRTLYMLTHFSVEVHSIGNFTNIMKILKNHYYTMDSIMEEVHQKCEDLLVHCSFNTKEKKCSDLFTMIKTSEGFCCAFNYAGTIDDSAYSKFDEDFEYYDGDADDDEFSSRIIANSKSGRLSGLFVVVDVEPEEYPPWSHTRYYGTKILITDPNDYPEANVKYRYLAMGESMDIKVDPMVFQTENALRRVDVQKRNCWFHDEVPLGSTDRYSTETCTSECKMATYQRSCNCVPYKYPRNKHFRVCELEDLKCLHNVTVSTSKSEMKCEPVCFVECSDKKYSISSNTNTFLSEKISEDLKNHEHFTHLSGLHIYFAKPTCNCYKMTVLINTSYIIATYGGVFSLFFGGSLLTVAELLYILVNYIVARVKNTLKYVETKFRTTNTEGELNSEKYFNN